MPDGQEVWVHCHLCHHSSRQLLHLNLDVAQEGLAAPSSDQLDGLHRHPREGTSPLLLQLSANASRSWTPGSRPSPYCKAAALRCCSIWFEEVTSANPIAEANKLIGRWSLDVHSSSRGSAAHPGDKPGQGCHRRGRSWLFPLPPQLPCVASPSFPFRHSFESGT